MALAEDIFVGFDVSDEDKPFLLNVLLAPGTPWDEKLAIYDLGLFSGYEDWNLMLESAASLKEKDLARSPLDARDILAYIPRVKETTLAAEKLRQGWAATDQSIKNLAALLRVHRSGHTVEPQPRPPSQPAVIKRERVVKREVVAPKRGREEEDDDEEAEPKQRVKRHRAAPKPSTSHYFAPLADEQLPRTRPEQQSVTPSPVDTAQTVTSALIRNGIATPNPTPRKQSQENEAPKEGTTAGQDPLHPQVTTQNSGAAASETNDDNSGALKASGPQTAGSLRAQPISNELVRIIVPGGAETGQVRELAPSEPSPRRKTAIKSPFFGQPQTKPSPRSKRVGGLVSTIPFPPLSAPRFGLIQEEFAHEPFWLLVVVTFLVKTAGTLAIPTFYKVKERFPTPIDLAEPEATTTIVGMIHHLGLSIVRTAAIQRYARLWLEKPPTAGVVYRVKNYDKRDVELETLRPDSDEDSLELTTGHAGEAGEAWEMGHFTQGKYALDSWRIFCRDELLGRAEDWNGKGAAPNFQPEWMRVRPDDKELRACLRWMWMREGWEWDPATGEKTVLRDEMRRAVNEGRVDYDNAGELVILDEPRSG
ncbi:methyl-CpG-binding domain protein 4 [Colletotrichum spaethianum]|uniref:Methyl-CpG-binding domain protein 4 n=1 Tax=Colletotrichum spaethianum TaxID=700344 RepID=A0AA37L4W1_9PEZI|nr:methyl-CpG-binding domain protein 4 [Colletotrichum spaethianum]GKT41938.1 methyl-CpG-binding domain protein 4 [Colletotrichum spaethianum]